MYTAEQIAVERNLTLDPNGNTYLDEYGNEYRNEQGECVVRGAKYDTL